MWLLLVYLFHVSSATLEAHGPASSTPPLRLLLSSHTGLGWYTPDSGSFQLLHSANDTYYGVVPGQDAGEILTSVWVVVRPIHADMGPGSLEYLVEIDLNTGSELNRKILPVVDGHDAVRLGNNVYLTDTRRGKILQYSLPSFNVVRHVEVFSKRDHLNTLAPINDTHIWALLHKSGLSDLVLLRWSSNPDIPPSIIQRVIGVGTNAHGIVVMPHGELLVVDSIGGKLNSVDPSSGTVTTLWQTRKKGFFLKGLAVVDDIVYVGLNLNRRRGKRSNPKSILELAAFDLSLGTMLWRRTVPRGGCLNVIATPQLGVGSTYTAMYTRAPLS